MIIITGGSGKLGSKLTEEISRSYHHLLLRPTRIELDVSSKGSVDDWFNNFDNVFGCWDIAWGQRYKEVAFIHCAAAIGLELCENLKGTTWNTNVRGTDYLSNECKKRKIKFYYISTDYVFDGKGGDYGERDTPNPKSFYAMTKLLGEQPVLLRGQNVIRLSHFPSPCTYKFAYADKYTSAASPEIIASQIYKVVNYNYLKTAKGEPNWEGVLHIGMERNSFYNLATSDNPDNKIKRVKAPKGTPMDTSFCLDKFHNILKEYNKMEERNG